MVRLSLTLLGGFQGRLGVSAPLTLPTRKTQALLAFLALPPGRSHPREKLASLLWGGMREPQARSGLRQSLFTLRKAVGAEPPALLIDGETVALNPSSVDVDVVEFERQVAEGTPGALERAAALYRGELLEGLALQEAPFEEWLLAERERLRELALEALAKLLRHQRTTEATEAALQTALRLLALDPLQEPVHRAVMRLYVAAGPAGVGTSAVPDLYRRSAARAQRGAGNDDQAALSRDPSAAAVARGGGRGGPGDGACGASRSAAPARRDPAARAAARRARDRDPPVTGGSEPGVGGTRPRRGLDRRGGRRQESPAGRAHRRGGCPRGPCARRALLRGRADPAVRVVGRRTARRPRRRRQGHSRKPQAPVADGGGAPPSRAGHSWTRRPPRVRWTIASSSRAWRSSSGISSCTSRWC